MRGAGFAPTEDDSQSTKKPRTTPNATEGVDPSVLHAFSSFKAGGLSSMLGARYRELLLEAIRRAVHAVSRIKYLTSCVMNVIIPRWLA